MRRHIAEATVWLETNRDGLQQALERRQWVVEQANKTAPIEPKDDEDLFFITYSIGDYERDQNELREFLDAGHIAAWAMEYDYDDLSQPASNFLEHMDLETVAMWKTLEKTEPVLRDSDDPKFKFMFEPGYISGIVTLLGTRDKKVLARRTFEASNSDYAKSFDAEDLNKTFGLERLKDQLLQNAEEAAKSVLEPPRRAPR